MGKIRCNSDIGCNDMFKYYKKQTEESKELYWKSGAVFRKVLIDFHRRLAEVIIKENYEYKAFARMGDFKILQRKTKIKVVDGKLDVKRLRINWFETKKLWTENPELYAKKFVYHNNSHSSGYFYKWKWDRWNATVSNKNNYYFTPVRYNQRLIAKIVGESEKQLFFFES